jgi:thymidylate synthase
VDAVKQYLDLVRDVLENGHDRGDRTGTGTRSVFGRQIRFNLRDGFPLVTTKRVPFRLVAAELIWFLSGSTNNNDLARLSGCDPDKTIWAEWAAPNGEMGPIYGAQWRRWAGWDGRSVDQIQGVINEIKHNPDSRRLIVSAWNATDLPIDGLLPSQSATYGLQALPPCHTLFQFYVRDGKHLDCQLYQRSADIFLGVPFNIASYALLTHIIANECNLTAGEFVHTFGDLHLYHNHFEQARTMLKREPRQLPEFAWAPGATKKHWEDLTPDDFTVLLYDPHPAIPAPVAV